MKNLYRGKSSRKPFRGTSTWGENFRKFVEEYHYQHKFEERLAREKTHEHVQAKRLLIKISPTWLRTGLNSHDWSKILTYIMYACSVFVIFHLGGNTMHEMVHEMHVGMALVIVTPRFGENGMHEMMNVMHVEMQMGDWIFAELEFLSS